VTNSPNQQIVSVCVLTVALAWTALVEPSSAAGLRQLTTAPGIDGGPCWSPDGTRIVFDSERVGSVGFDLWILPATGGTAERLTSELSNEYGASWSPDGKTIAYYWSRDGKIHLTPADGGAGTVFTPGNRGEQDPAWSPDGKQIAFASTGPVVVGSVERDIWVREVSSGLERRLTTHPASDEHPTWSPDAATVAFVSERGGRAQLWTVPTSGGQPVRLSELDALQPAWSPDGDRIAFVSDGDLYVISLRGGAAVRVTSGAELDYAPAWSPSSDEIVFMRRDGDEADLWIVDVMPVAVRGSTWSEMKQRLDGRRR